MLSIDTIRNLMSTLDVVASGVIPTPTSREQKLYTELKQLSKQYPNIEITFGDSSVKGRLQSMSLDHLTVNVSDAIANPAPVTVKLLKQRSSGQCHYLIDRIDIL
jgi:hypothetical protein